MPSLAKELAMVWLLVGGLVQAAEPVTPKWVVQPDGVRVASGIPYAEAGGETLKLDLALPAGKGPFPTVVCFHGGSWRFGSRADMGTYIRRFAEHGYAAASVSYRFMPKHKFPTQIVDAKTAVRFLRTHASQLDLATDRFAALGLSAGGHLAALLGVTDKADGLDGPLYPNVSSQVQAVVDFFGPTDMSLYTCSEGLLETFMVPFLGMKCRSDPATVKKASPIEYVSASAAPTLIIHGNADVIVPVIHSERFYEKLKKAGVEAELIVVPGGGHGWADEATRRMTALAALKFLDQHLKGGK